MEPTRNIVLLCNGLLYHWEDERNNYYNHYSLNIKNRDSIGFLVAQSNLIITAYSFGKKIIRNNNYQQDSVNNVKRNNNL